MTRLVSLNVGLWVANGILRTRESRLDNGGFFPSNSVL